MANVNYIKHMRGTWQRFSQDPRLSSTHRILYFALFECWNRNRFYNPVSINREEMMRLTGIGTQKLYYKCIQELDKWQYIQYTPSHNMYVGSKVVLSYFDLTEYSTEATTEESTEPPTGEVQGVPSINGINKKKHKKDIDVLNVLKPSHDQNKTENKNGQTHTKDNFFKNKSTNTADAQEPVFLKKGKTTGGPARAAGRANIPSIEEVIEFFSQLNADRLEAEKFVNHYESIGWEIAGDPVWDWRALAYRWIAKIDQFNIGRGHLR